MTHHHHFFEFSFTLHLRFNDKQISISNSRQMDSVIRKKFLSPKKNISTFLFAKERKKKKNSRKTSESNSFHGLKKFSSDCCSTNRATSCKKEKNMDDISRDIEGDHNRSHVAISRARYFQDSLPEKMYLFPRGWKFLLDGVSPVSQLRVPFHETIAYPSAFEKESVEGGGSIEIGGL